MPRAPKRDIKEPIAKDLNIAQVLEEYAEAASAVHDYAKRASMAGNASQARDLHVAAGIFSDRWKELRDAPDDITDKPVLIGCECHSSQKKVARSRKILKTWIPKALLNARQFMKSLAEDDGTHTVNIKNWAASAGIAAQKIIAYANDAAISTNTAAFMGAHRAEIIAPGGLLDKLSVAADALRAGGKKAPDVNWRSHDATSWREQDLRLDLGERE